MKAAAQRRVAALVDPALDALATALASSDSRTALAAARLVLDLARIGEPDIPFGWVLTVDLVESEIARLEREVFDLDDEGEPPS